MMSDPDTALIMSIEKLKAVDPVVREDGIRALELLGDTVALPALSEVFATDPDPTLRALAQQAGKAIYYGAIRQSLQQQTASDEERRQAAEILAQAREKKLKNRRGK
jgi:hypothetical protein